MSVELITLRGSFIIPDRYVLQVFLQNLRLWVSEHTNCIRSYTTEVRYTYFYGNQDQLWVKFLVGSSSHKNMITNFGGVKILIKFVSSDIFILTR